MLKRERIFVNIFFVFISYLCLLPGYLSQCWNSLINTALSDISWTDMVLSQTAQQIKKFLSIDDSVTYEK